MTGAPEQDVHAETLAWLGSGRDHGITGSSSAGSGVSGSGGSDPSLELFGPFPAASPSLLTPFPVVAVTGAAVVGDFLSSCPGELVKASSVLAE